MLQHCISPTRSQSPPMNVPPPPLPPMSRAPAAQTNAPGAGGGTGGCPKCRFATIATPTHNRHSNNNGYQPHLHHQLSTGFANNNSNLQNFKNSANNFLHAKSFTGVYDERHDNRYHEEEDSACPALLEREFHSLHRNVPGLRRAGVDTTAIRQHFYPDGGWGWIVCGVAFLAHVLTTGFQLSYGLLYLYAIKHLGQDDATEIGWLGSASWSTSMFSTTIVVAFCLRKSTRITAVLGGLVLALGILFTSFATQLHQVAFSYGLVVGVGSALVRESAVVMLGHYFKRRRLFVEMILMSGEGIGIALFSVILKDGVGKMGWRLGLQAVTGLCSLCFFMGMLYRSASLYHPQRRAILHLKNQRKKVKEKKTHVQTPKPPFLDFSPFCSSTVRLFVIIITVATTGIYSPIFFMSFHGFQEGYDMQDLVLLQTFLGLSIAAGVVTSGSTINRPCHTSYKNFYISRQYMCQGSLVIISISLLVLSYATEYRNMCLLAWTYGLGIGSFRYTFKMLALERVRGKHFTKAWGFIKSAEAIPVLLGVPLTGYLNESSNWFGRPGYFVCSAATAIAAIMLFFVGHQERRNNKVTSNGSMMSNQGAMMSDCPDVLNRSFSAHYNPQQWYPSPFTSITNTQFSGNSLNPNCQRYLPSNQNHVQYPPAYQSNQCGYGGSLRRHPRGNLQKSLSFAFQTPFSLNEDNRKCQNYPYQQQQHVSTNHCQTNTLCKCRKSQQFQPQQLSYCHHPQYNHFQVPHPNRSHHHAAPGAGGAPQQYPSRSLSVPEGLSFIHSSTYDNECQLQRCHYQCRSINDLNHHHHPHSIQVIEQMTTSV